MCQWQWNSSEMHKKLKEMCGNGWYCSNGIAGIAFQKKKIRKTVKEHKWSVHQCVLSHVTGHCLLLSASLYECVCVCVFESVFEREEESNSIFLWVAILKQCHIVLLRTLLFFGWVQYKVYGDKTWVWWLGWSSEILFSPRGDLTNSRTFGKSGSFWYISKF